MNWREVLSTLREHLRGRDDWGVRGSLRWLEEAMRARGASPGSVRNIVYRDVGNSSDKRALHAILSALGQEAGVSVPPLPSRAESLPVDMELLGRSKKRAFRGFINALRAGRAPRMLVVGPAGVGKTLLIEHLERELTQLEPPVPVTRLLLSGNVVDALGSGSAVHPGMSFAAQQSEQARAAQQFLKAHFPAASGVRGVLLLRVGAGDFAGAPPRGEHAEPVSLAVWAAQHLLAQAPGGVAALLASEDEAGLTHLVQAQPAVGELLRLRPPTPAEARAYLMTRLGIDASAADALVRRTGRHLDRLSMLAAAGGKETLGAERWLADSQAAALLSALHAVLGEDASAPREVIEAALGHPLTQLPGHVRALLDEVSLAIRPISRQVLSDAAALLPAAEVQAARWRLAAALRDLPAYAAWYVRALSDLGEWNALAQWAQLHPEHGQLAAGLWSRARREAPAGAVTLLARSVVSVHAALGHYDHPQARDALFTLLEAPQVAVRVWGRVKLAESSVDAGNFEAAGAQLSQPEVISALRGEGRTEQGGVSAQPSESEISGAWLGDAQADALLVEAALSRWRGDLAAATAYAQDPRTAKSGARAVLWRGLIAKDAGEWESALKFLRGVPVTSPLLRARARYQEGDLRLRLGHSAASLHALQDAAEWLLAAGAAPQERARAEARLATALRRMGQLDAAQQRSEAAQHLAQGADPVLRARLISEAVPLLLAQGHFEGALAAAGRALSDLALPGPRRAEAAYRLRRTLYRVALTYLSRGLKRPYVHPLRGPEHDNPDLQWARQLLTELLAAPAGPADREQVLRFDMLLSAALAEPSVPEALALAQRALALTDHPYAEAQARAMLAEVYLRAADLSAALREINRAHALLRRLHPPGEETRGVDPGLVAQLLTLEACALLTEGAPTLHWLRGALSETPLQPFQAGVWREVGRALEAQHPQAAAIAREVFPGMEHYASLRLSDALALAATETRPA